MRKCKAVILTIPIRNILCLGAETQKDCAEQNPAQPIDFR